MAELSIFPALLKPFPKWKVKSLLRFSDDGSLALRKEREKKKEPTVQGVFRANKAGFGFLHVDENEDDMFIGRNDVGYAIDGDTVEVVVKKPADRLKGTAAEAKVVAIVDRSLKTAVGTFILDDDKPKYAGYIRSKNQKIQQKSISKKNLLCLKALKSSRLILINTPHAGTIIL